MSTIRSEMQSLSPSALIELYALDMTNTVSGGILYFHAGTNALSGPVVWQGQVYTPWPIETKGFDLTTDGALPRPRLSVANTGGLFSGEIQANDDLLGCMLVRKRTYARFLDAVNFPGGVNPEADPNKFAPDEQWFIDQKVSENRYIVEFDLASPFDLMGIQLPYRQVIKNSCPWQYRGSECGYHGPFFDKNDLPGTALTDTCPKLLNSCKKRMGQNQAPYTLNFGGFPGATRYEV